MSEGLIDAAWRAAHPLPDLGDGMDKNARGQGLIVGGSASVPGALLLTGEAMLRTGAGKVRLATVDRAAIGVGVAFPEAAVVALPADEDGEIDASAATLLARHLEHCDALILGPGMIERQQAAELVEKLLDSVAPATSILLDAGALTALRGKRAVPRALEQPVVMTPHHGELARLTGIDEDVVTRDPAKAATETAAAFGTIIALKAAETVIADGHGRLLLYSSDAPGLGTAGSGDVLAGIIGGLLARGVDPFVATAWGVWLHGEAGKAAATTIGPVGFLARDLPRHLPRLMASQ
ncbi:MAG: NAD(P)H-hydrate dehydratase [Sphingomonas bacterium]|uniref:NAD(P)H-hydrate dehydratase n=1 Tax=Sphingomonas bacterium TaxID=1895847 RepID=UPI00261A0C7C|nr:NAD(P)H-hydrate dehydratase [Sphingomonas bacterium]MDB5710348.1 NAD(P)H-hydrate dehydratase [Sphingomonas bacterium]